MGHVGHHRKKSAARLAAKIALALGIVICVAAISSFVYNAVDKSNCLEESYNPATGVSSYSASSGDCAVETIRDEQFMRIDAGIAALGIAMVIAGAVWLSRASRRARRLLLMGEAAVVVVAAVYVTLYAYTFR